VRKCESAKVRKCELGIGKWEVGTGFALRLVELSAFRITGTEIRDWNIQRQKTINSLRQLLMLLHTTID
jgi:hypothetical protein